MTPTPKQQQPDANETPANTEQTPQFKRIVFRPLFPTKKRWATEEDRDNAEAWRWIAEATKDV